MTKSPIFILACVLLAIVKLGTVADARRSSPERRYEGQHPSVARQPTVQDRIWERRQVYDPTPPPVGIAPDYLCMQAGHTGYCENQTPHQMCSGMKCKAAGRGIAYLTRASPDLTRCGPGHACRNGNCEQAPRRYTVRPSRPDRRC